MKGQISLETLIVLAAMSGVLVLFAARYAEIEDMVLQLLKDSRENYTATVLMDVSRNCNGLTVEVSFPYTVRIDCKYGKAYIGGKEIGLQCNRDINGKSFRITSCYLMQTS